MEQIQETAETPPPPERTDPDLDKLRHAISLLTRRQRTIFIALAQGQTASEIGRRLDISVKTSASHRDHLLKKLRRLGFPARGNADLAWLALRAGSISLVDRSEAAPDPAPPAP